MKIELLKKQDGPDKYFYFICVDGEVQIGFGDYDYTKVLYNYNSIKEHLLKKKWQKEPEVMLSDEV